MTLDGVTSKRFCGCSIVETHLFEDLGIATWGLQSENSEKHQNNIIRERLNGVFPLKNILKQASSTAVLCYTDFLFADHIRPVKILVLRLAFYFSVLSSE